MSATSRWKTWSIRFLTFSGSSGSAKVVYPTRSANRTVTTRRSSEAVASGPPHEEQNRAPGSLTAPHDGQDMVVSIRLRDPTASVQFVDRAGRFGEIAGLSGSPRSLGSKGSAHLIPSAPPGVT